MGFLSASTKTYGEGQVIFSEGSTDDRAYRILSGSVEISKLMGGRTFVVEILRKGDIFGQCGFPGPARQPATARAIRETTLAPMDRDSIEADMARLSADVMSLFKALLKRAGKTADAACELSSRSGPRIRKSLAVTYGTEDGTRVRACSNDISSSGLSIRTRNPLEKGKKFPMELYLPGLGETMKINCEVAWSRGPAVERGGDACTMGIRFHEMDETHGELLKHFINTVRLIS